MLDSIPLKTLSNKICIQCSQEKPAADFYQYCNVKKDGTKQYGYRDKCKDCCREHSRNKHAVFNAHRGSHLKRSYGLTEMAYETMWKSQNGRCAACKRHEKDCQEPNLPHRRLVVDHCHKTGTVRDLLCGPCNRMFGAMNEDPIRIRGLLTYAEKWKPPHEWPQGGRLM